MEPSLATEAIDAIDAIDAIEPAGAPTARPTRVRPWIVGELAVVAALLVVYDHVRSLARVHRGEAVDHGSAIFSLEHSLHLRVEPAVNHWLSGQALLGRLSVDYYQFLHVGVAMSLLVACYVLRPHVYRPARNALLVVNAVGLAVYALYPVAPPRLLPGSGFLDMVARAGFGTTHGGPIPVNQYGAMPSLHIAWAVWVALVGFAVTEVVWLRTLLVAHPLVTTFVVVGTANHYLLDAVGGVVLGCVAVAVAFGLHLRARRGRFAAAVGASGHAYDVSGRP